MRLPDSNLSETSSSVELYSLDKSSSIDSLPDHKAELTFFATSEKFKASTAVNILLDLITNSPEGYDSAENSTPKNGAIRLASSKQ